MEKIRQHSRLHLSDDDDLVVWPDLLPQIGV